MGKDKILLTVAARGGSKGVKNKNIRPLCGKPLIAHTLLQARRWGKAARIVCSTDSNAIAQAARKYGAEVPFMRPDKLATDTAGKIGVLRHALQEAEEIYSERYAIVVDLDVTAPVRKISDIDGAVKLFKRERPHSVFSVSPARRNPYFNMVEVAPNGFARIVKDPGALMRRQDAPVVYDMNASIYVYDRRYLLDPATQRTISKRSLAWVMDEFSGFDIDTEADFQFIEFLVRRKFVTL